LLSAVAQLPGSSNQMATTATGSDQPTPDGTGDTQLVTPLLVRSRYQLWQGGEMEYYFAGTARAEIHFVPEPALLALLVPGIALLAFLRRPTRTSSITQ